MSGLFGFVSTRRAPVDSVGEMARRLRVTPHVRTPHADVAAGVAFGVATLGRLGWESSPVRSADGRFTLWMVGEFVHHERRLREVERAREQDFDGSMARFALELYCASNAAGVASTSGTFQVTVWDAEKGQPIHTVQHKGALSAVTFTVDGARIVSSGGVDKSIRVWYAAD